MKRVLKLFFCILLAGISLYSYIDMQNTLTAQRIRIPQLAQEIKAIEEHNIRLQYEIDAFEHPFNLIAVAKEAGLNHLKHPLLCDVVHLKEGVALHSAPPHQPEIFYVKQPRITLGAKP
ncbi:MAG TPA: hypothetical protein VLF61_03695 [Rhabdochlamydiaceae bacterium]|nr:hypothetical protein [Rhabdochlamydiaceae bacterium]